MALQKYVTRDKVKKNPKRMYKLGYTFQPDANDRQDVDFGKGKPPLGRDFDVTTLWSAWVTPEQRIELEDWFKDTFPKDLWTEVFYNGITECRAFDYATSKQVSDYLYAKYPSYKHVEAPGLDHVYFQMLVRKTQVEALAIN